MSYFLIIMLAFGFAFILIQGTRRELTYRMRLVSSDISVALAFDHKPPG